MFNTADSQIVLSRAEIYFYDNYTIEKLGIPGIELMENAGRNCTDYIQKNLIKSGSRTLIVCGTGNNGGDGFVIARYLHKFGHKVEIMLLGSPDKMSPETSENYLKCQNIDLPIKIVDSSDELENSKIYEFDLIVDAIFGIGFKGEVTGWRKDLIEQLNGMNSIRVSIDIASGIDADTGQVETAVQADYTLTMAAAKYGHFLGKGRKFTGKLEIIDIGIPKHLFEQIPPQAKLINIDNVIYPARCEFSHKGDYGRVGIIGGSAGFSGAALMAASAALRAGAGLVTIFHPAGREAIFASTLWEAMNYSLPETETGFIDFDLVWQKLIQMDVLLIGPGLGTEPKSADFLKKLLQVWKKPIVLDADALNIISQNRELLKLLKRNILLTPHLGEFARLSELSIAQVQDNSPLYLTKFCEEYNCTVLLKSATSLYCESKDGNSTELYFNISGNDALSTGGSGDVLAGIITSFIGQGSSIQEAATAGSFLLGITAEKLSLQREPRSIIPTDIVANLFKY